MQTTLDTLRVGCGGVICALCAVGEARGRLLDLGFVPGARVCALHESPWGDPVAYGVRGGVIALRRADARMILISRKG